MIVIVSDMKMKKPISIIIPCYNDEKYIRQCMDSVVSQTNAAELLEVVVVNDGGTDGSVDIIKEFCQKYDYIKLILQENGGVSAARNRGLQEISGDYIYFLDSDDYLEPDAMEECYQRAMKSKADIVTFDTKPFLDTESVPYTLQVYKRSLKENYVYKGSEAFSYMEKQAEYYPPVWLYFYSRKFFIDNSFEFIEGIVYEDTPFTFKILNSAERVVYIPKVFHNRRTHANSIMRTALNVKHIYSNNMGIQDMLNYYKTQGKNQDSKEEQIHFIKGIASGNWITILRAENNSNGDKKNEIKAFITILKNNPKIISSKMLIDILKGVKAHFCR